MLLRKEPDTRHKHGAFDCIIETADDLELDKLTEMGLGSLAYCVENNKVYAKTTIGWEDVGGDTEISPEAIVTATDNMTDEQAAETRSNLGALGVDDIGTVFNLKGSVANVASLPASGNTIGDVYFVTENSSEYLWMTSAFRPNGYWEELGKRTEHYTATWTLTVTGTIFSWSCNRTYTQIYDAYSAGKQVIFNYDEQSEFATFVAGQGGDSDYFTSRFTVVEGGETYNCDVYMASGTGATSSKELAVTPASVVTAVNDMTSVQKSGVLSGIGGEESALYVAIDDTTYAAGETFATIKAAINEGRRVIFRIAYYSATAELQVVGYQGDNYLVAASTAYFNDPKLLCYVLLADETGALYDFDLASKPGTVTDLSSTSITLATINANTKYQYGELSDLTVTAIPASGEFSITFTSGATATVLTVPNTMIMPDGFTVEANTRYEINVSDGYALVAGWAVSA